MGVRGKMEVGLLCGAPSHEDGRSDLYLEWAANRILPIVR